MRRLLPPASHVSFTEQQQVAEEWLAEEQSKDPSKTLDIEAEDERHEVEAKLLGHKPGVARRLLDLNLSWSRCRLSEAALRTVYTVWGNPADRNTVEAVANGIRAGESFPRVCNVDRIEQLAAEEPDDWGTLVIVHHQTPWKRGSPVLLDGNHRAVAAILRAERQGLYEPRHAYVGYSGPSKISQFRRFLHASLDIL